MNEISTCLTERKKKSGIVKLKLYLTGQDFQLIKFLTRVEQPTKMKSLHLSNTCKITKQTSGIFDRIYQHPATFSFHPKSRPHDEK